MTDTTANQTAPRWDLEPIFPGGSDSREYKQYRENLRQFIDRLSEKFKQAEKKKDNLKTGELVELTLELQKAYARFLRAYSFAGCLASQDVKDDRAFQIIADMQEIDSRWQNLQNSLQSLLAVMDDSAFAEFISDPKVKPVEFYLNERREIARLKMDPKMESLVLDLEVNGYHAWNNIYTKMAGDSTVEFYQDGKITEISLGQLHSKMSSSDRSIRKQAFDKLTEAWQKNLDLASMTLNSQAGFRLSVYNRRNWDDALFEPLILNRIKGESLQAMWQSVMDHAPKFNEYIDAKKKLLGIDRFRWYDQMASAGKIEKRYTYEQASEFILEQVEGFSPEMAEFIKMALSKNWVEAENRPGKAAGGFCTDFGEVKESRIFMTYDGTYDDMMTLAHELGHAWHHHVLVDEPIFNTFYTMGLAETASTFNEMLVTDAALEKAESDEERLMLLDQKLMNGYTFFCNIHARFLFDVAFYRERANGTVSKDRLNQIMTEAQAKAYAGTLDPQDGYHPEFWASKLHFFETEMPFYNFPYTFGFLFSNAVYQRASREGSAFAGKYKQLLMDTGRMKTEDLVKKHLDADISDISLWNQITEKVVGEIPEFLKLAQK